MRDAAPPPRRRSHSYRHEHRDTAAPAKPPPPPPQPTARRHKVALAHTDAPSLVRQIVIAVPAAVLPDELAGLAINLTLHPLTAHHFLVDGGARELLDRAVRTRDPRVMRLVRNLATQTFESQAAAAADVWGRVRAGEPLPTWSQLKRRSGRRRRRKRAEAARGEDEDEDSDDGGGKRAAGPTPTLSVEQPGTGDADPDHPSVMDSYRYEMERLWPDLLRDLVRLLSVDSPDLRIEVLGTLACLTPRDFPPHLGWADILGMPGERRPLAAPRTEPPPQHPPRCPPSPPPRSHGQPPRAGPHPRVRG